MDSIHSIVKWIKGSCIRFSLTVRDAYNCHVLVAHFFFKKRWFRLKLFCLLHL